MSLRNFVRRFKDATGDSPLIYLQKLRVAAAKRLLESDHRTMQEISEAVGYQDVGLFPQTLPAPHRRLPQRVPQKVRNVAHGQERCTAPAWGRAPSPVQAEQGSANFMKLSSHDPFSTNFPRAYLTLLFRGGISQSGHRNPPQRTLELWRLLRAA